MENRSSKIIAMIGLIAGVVGISLGFAAFSNTLTIKSEATVTPSGETFDVNLSTTQGTTTAGDLTVDNYELSEGVTLVETPTIVNGTKADGTATLQNIKVNFTAPGQTAKFTVYAENDGEYMAYLKTVQFLAAEDATGSETKVCSTTDATITDALYQAACGKISYSIKVGNETFTTPATANTLTANGTHSLVKQSGSEPVEITITYSADGDARADGSFDVAFGDIKLVYNTVAPSA